MPQHKKLVAQRRPNQSKKTSPATSNQTKTISCSVCHNEKLDVHPIGSSKITEIVGCNFCRLRYLRVKLTVHETDFSLFCIYCYQTFSDKDNFHLHLQQHGDFLRMSPFNISNSSQQIANSDDQVVSLAKGEKPQFTRQNSKGFQFTSQQSPENSIEDVVGTMLTLGSSLNILNSDSQPVREKKIPPGLSRADTIIIQPQVQTGYIEPSGIHTRSSAIRKKIATRQSRASGLESSKASGLESSRASGLESSDTLDLSSLHVVSQSVIARQSSNASDTTTIVTDGETSSGKSSLKKDDTIILEVLDNDGNKSDQILLTSVSSMDKISDLDFTSLCQSILGPQTSFEGKLASEDTIDRILPGFSMSIINLLQEDEMIIVNDQNQGKSFQIRRVPSESVPANNPNTVQESPSNTESQSLVIPQRNPSKRGKQPDPEKTPRLRDTRKRRTSPKEEEEATDKKRGRHVEKEQHTCPDCGKVFSRRYNLKVHRYVHSEQKMFECEKCRQQFKHVSLLRNHMRIKHSGNKPFTCNTCGQGFIHNNYLQRHMLLHISEVCVCCDEKFESRRQFNAHVRSVHVRSDSSKHCQKCDLTFVSLLELCQHLLGISEAHQ